MNRYLAIKYSIRTLFIFLVFASVLLATINHFRRAGAKESESVGFLNESGCWILPDYQLSTVPSPTQPGRYIQTRSHGSSPHKKPFAMFLGQHYYEYHTDVIIENRQIPVVELLTHLKNLRKLEYVFYTPNAGLTDSDIKSLESSLPKVKVVSALKLGNK